MSCSKPSGNPGAIFAAADAIDRYANAVTTTEHDLQLVAELGTWSGDVAAQAMEVLTQFEECLGEYSGGLHEYAQQIRVYAEELQRAQSCSIREILTWVLLIVFAVVEIVIGFFCGGAIDAALMGLFATIADALSDAATAIGGLALQAIEAASSFSGAVARSIGNILTTTPELGFPLGGASLEGGVAVARVGGGIFTRASVELGGGAVRTAAQTGSGLRATVTGARSSFESVGGTARVVTPLGAAGTTPLADVSTELSMVSSLLSRSVTQTLAKGELYLYKAVYNTAEWYLQELVIRGVVSLDRRSGGFVAQWHDTEVAETLAIFTGMIAGSLGFDLSRAFLGTANKLLLSAGIDISAGLTRVSKVIRSLLPSADDASVLRAAATEVDGASHTASVLTRAEKLAVARTELRATEIGTNVSELTHGSVVAETFEEVLENVWDYGSILALYPVFAHEDFDVHEWWWYVVFGLVETLIHVPTKEAAGKVYIEHFGTPPSARPGFATDFPLLSEAAKNLGDLMIVGGMSIFRKVALDPLLDIEGSFTEYIDQLRETGELEQFTLTTDPSAPAEPH
ncbi:hypothetical protein LLS1_24230 [Leifsonia sp. LS1]|uniref:hypothetical protein n=1 Tax=Leifsonia sp. LS1 TaxID=2828483 RepID=UPI001CFD2754|nr:hypothetical protein [Leifsonia sp. LS1]GIT80754.1 hypothetical protein LLS1_24230 [Leifsonia sp. LS1]